MNNLDNKIAWFLKIFFNFEYTCVSCGFVHLRAGALETEGHRISWSWSYRKFVMSGLMWVPGTELESSAGAALKS